MKRKTWVYILAMGLSISFCASTADAMIRHIFIFQPANMEAFSDYYFSTHSKECVRHYGPWLRRYETYSAHQVPKEAERFNVVRGRLTEMWWDSVEAWEEADPYSWPYSPMASSPVSEDPGVPGGNMMIMAMPAENFLGKAPLPSKRPFIRWIIMFGYPEGVSLEEGEEWYLEEYAPAVKKIDGLLRFVSYRAPEKLPPFGELVGTQWVRMTEMWFKDYDAWRKAFIESPPDIPRPDWATSDEGPHMPMVSTFVDYLPEVDFLQASPLPRPIP